MSLDRYLDDFGRHLEHAAHAVGGRPSRAPRRPVFGLGGGALAVAIVVVAILLVVPASEHRLDAVAEARAALGTDGDIVHFLLRSRVVIENQEAGRTMRVPQPTTAEYWTATSPARWRVAFSYSDLKTRSGGTVRRDFLGRTLRGPAQVAYSDNALSTYVKAFDELRIVSGYAAGQASAVPTPVVLGSDPVASLRRLLDQRRLRDEGVIEVNARKVRRFAGIERRRVGSRTVEIGLRYDVDPATSTPISVRIEQPYARNRQAPRPVTVLQFGRYERLRLTTENARLLEIRPSTPPKRTVRMTLAEFREARQRDLSHRKPR